MGTVVNDQPMTFFLMNNEPYYTVEYYLRRWVKFGYDNMDHAMRFHAIA